MCKSIHSVYSPQVGVFLNILCVRLPISFDFERCISELVGCDFFLFQTSFTDFFFTKTLWPDFSKKLLKNIIIKSNNLERKFGK